MTLRFPRHLIIASPAPRRLVLCLAAAVLLGAAPAAIAGKTRRVSVKSGGAEVAGGDRFIPSISAKGCFVAFDSEATNLVSGDNNGLKDVFVRDRK